MSDETPTTTSQQDTLLQRIDDALAAYWPKASFFRRWLVYDADIRALVKLRERLLAGQASALSASDELIELAFQSHSRIPLLGYDFFRTSPEVKTCLLQACVGKNINSYENANIATKYSRWSLLFAVVKESFQKIDIDSLRTKFYNFVKPLLPTLSTEAQGEQRTGQPISAAVFPSSSLSVGFATGVFNRYRSWRQSASLELEFAREAKTTFSSEGFVQRNNAVKKAFATQVLASLIRQANDKISAFVRSNYRSFTDALPPGDMVRYASMREYLVAEIIKNAFDHKQGEQAELKINLRLSIDDHKRVVIEFTDNGSGFANVAKGQVLSGIPQSDKSRNSPRTILGGRGAGLRLGAECYDIELRNSAQEGEGAVVRIALGIKLSQRVAVGEEHAPNARGRKPRAPH